MRATCRLLGPLCLLALVVTAATAPAATAIGAVDPSIVAAVPNPVADEDVGEFVVVRVPPDSTANWTLSDGESTVSLPSDRPGARLAVTGAPNATRRLADAPVVAVSRLSLSNAGERLRLRRDGTVVATLDYRDAPAGERLVHDAAGRRWRPVGLQPRDVTHHGCATVTGFVLPDAPGVPVETLRTADRRILLAGYTFTSDRVADALVAATHRGVEVRVLVDGAPVGGRTARGAAVLDRLDAAGVEVRALGGPHARFEYHHPKYAVVDDRALVTSENWKPAGVGGRSSRGWGVVVDSPAVAADLAGLFRGDAGWRDAIPWRRHRRGETFEPGTPANGTFPSRIEPTTSAGTVRVLTAPGNAESAVVGIIDAADERVDVIQPTIGRRDGPLLHATIRAAARGVEVRVLLSGAWYVAEENAALAERLNGVAERRDLPLSARVAEPRGRFEKIHAKGVVADDVVVVGSLNWNANAVSDNREVAVAVRSAELAAYFRDAFVADWSRGPGRRTWVLAAGAAAALVLAALVAKRTVRFAD
jgi:phosphatidylserine/phosphatidylglycerophosphate/cardiolipin synthase-like enzyme